MSKVPAQIRAYVRPSRRHGQREQLAALEAAGIDQALTYVESKDETLGDCLKSLMPGDTVAVTSLGRLHNRRDGIVAAVREIAAKHVTIWEVSTGRKFAPGQLTEALECAVEALDELANDRRRMTPREARKAAQIRHGRTPTATAKAVWLDTVKFQTTGEALEQPEMEGWDTASAYKKLGPRGTAVRRKR